MWPFRRRRLPSSATPPSSAIAPAPEEPVARIEVESICPNCLGRFAPGTLRADFPCCDECYSEAVEIEVEPLTAWLEDRTVSDFDAMLARWDEREGYWPHFKQLVHNRIVELRALKATGEAEP